VTEATSVRERTTIRTVWNARQSSTEELLGRVRALAGEPMAPQRVTWVGDLQQGDGGKGAMADRLAAVHQIVGRVQGGDNAGHTTVFRGPDGQDRTVACHLLPSGLRHPGRVGVLGNGVLVNAERLADELAAFAAVVPDVSSRVLVSDRAHLVLPLHRAADRSQEADRGRQGQVIGTTLRGIGPANVSKTNRTGLRVADLRDPRLVRDRIAQNCRLFGRPEDEVEENVRWIERFREDLLGRAVDAARLVNAAADAGYSILLEGAQGPLIDPEMGIYPYVTTSPTAVYSVASGIGLDLTRVQHKVGVLKAYQTMVGAGAFVSEDHGGVGSSLRAAGGEYGTTTGRERRCGWLELVHARWAFEVNRYGSVVVTKLDVLDGFEEIGVCVGYRVDGRDLYEFRPEHAFLETCTPVYEYFPGWRCDTTGLESYQDLPAAARSFLDFIEDYLGTEVAGVTKGPRDTDMLVKPWSSLNAMYPS
jgi:adenylosuccinate synthase